MHTSAWTHCWRSQQHPSVQTRRCTCKVQAHRVTIHIHSSRCDLFRTAHYLVWFRVIWILNFECAGRSLFWLSVCLSVIFCFWMARWGTLEMTAALLLASSRLKMVWMMSLHHGKLTSSFETKERVSFVILALQWWFCTIQHTKTISKAEKAPSY